MTGQRRVLEPEALVMFAAAGLSVGIVKLLT